MHQKRRLSATEARVHFGEVLRRVGEGEVILVEGRGKPLAVILSPEAYERLKGEGEDPFRLILSVNRGIRERLGRPLAPPEEVIGAMREEGDRELPGPGR
ncbi:type II toxin-antitoxin system Phd/YefM family antitoxin [Thermus thermamylovorans]|nr:type II toxin-antitoxin system Phd/YefM family antitoxin [Thermus thermamylovorans]